MSFEINDIKPGNTITLATRKVILPDETALLSVVEEHRQFLLYRELRPIEWDVIQIDESGDEWLVKRSHPARGQFGLWQCWIVKMSHFKADLLQCTEQGRDLFILFPDVERSIGELSCIAIELPFSSVRIIGQVTEKTVYVRKGTSS